MLCIRLKRLFDHRGSDPSLQIIPAKGHSAFANQQVVASSFDVFGSHTMSLNLNEVNALLLNCGS